MTITYSTQLTNLAATPPVVAQPCDLNAKLRIMQFDHVQAADGAADDLVYVAKLPPGRVRLLGNLSKIYHAVVTVESIDIGWAAYTDFDEAAVAADPDGLDDGIVTTSAGTITCATVLAAVGATKVFESLYGVNITIQCKTQAWDADDVLHGQLVYAVE